MKAQADPDIAIMLVGNKVDKTKNGGRDVEEHAAMEFAKKHGLLFKETSALSDTNVTSAFEDLLTHIDEDRSKLSKNSKKPYGVVLGPDYNNFNEEEDSGCKC